MPPKKGRDSASSSMTKSSKLSFFSGQTAALKNYLPRWMKEVHPTVDSNQVWVDLCCGNAKAMQYCKTFLQYPEDTFALGSLDTGPVSQISQWIYHEGAKIMGLSTKSDYEKVEFTVMDIGLILKTVWLCATSSPSPLRSNKLSSMPSSFSSPMAIAKA
ncbi:hypothetical protein CPB84DRAFT_1749708 [Gymnopilus junonius]|uniref:Uncharacterized protein n=1 Tax=Gymnopilus junonius TaxID=109634 RepID=A0A9P5TJA4_GYMJU|nr:hypothetical protein CPB84DRAFT_1749708 [Gymnopilus junonius]